MRAVAALALLPLLAAPAPAAAEEAGFMLCEALPHITCVLSGDSFYLRGELIVLSDAEAPARYTSACPAASNRSWLAALKLRDLLNAGPFDLGEASHANEADLRLVTRHGRSIGEQLIEAGLAKARSTERASWCK